MEHKIVPSSTLPDGWRWEFFSDGSGILRNPEGEACVGYDLDTGEIWNRWENKYHFWSDYPMPLNISDAVREGEETARNNIKF